MIKAKPVKETRAFKTSVARHVVNAEGKIMGRVASEVARLLMGKTHAQFTPNFAPRAIVTVTGAAKMRVTGKKLESKIYYHHTGFLGHLKSRQLKEFVPAAFDEALRRAVRNMLPKSKLRPFMLKNLTIEL